MALYRPNANLLRNHALQFATIAHGNQVRKGNEHIPYIFHPVDVANEVIYYSALPVADLEVASVIALLHDTIEDTAVTEAQLREQFGDVMADGVVALSKEETAESASYSKREETLMGIARVMRAPQYVQAVKLADRVSNLKNFPAMWGREKVSSYLDESVMIARALSESSEGLHARLLARIADARVMLSLRT